MKVENALDRQHKKVRWQCSVSRNIWNKEYRDLSEDLPHVPVDDAVALGPLASLGVLELVHQSHLPTAQD